MGTDKEIKIAKAKECLTKLNSSLKEIMTDNKQKMQAVLKKRDEQKVKDILNELKEM